NCLGIEPAIGKAPQSYIVHVDLRRLFAVVAGLRVGVAEDDEAMESLQSPGLRMRAAGDCGGNFGFWILDFGFNGQLAERGGAKLIGEPIEEFGVRWCASHHTEIVFGVHEAVAEMSLPDAVRHDTRDERVFRSGHPAGQRKSSPGCRGFRSGA